MSIDAYDTLGVGLDATEGGCRLPTSPNGDQDELCFDHDEMEPPPPVGPPSPANLPSRGPPDCITLLGSWHLGAFARRCVKADDSAELRDLADLSPSGCQRLGWAACKLRGAAGRVLGVKLPTLAATTFRARIGDVLASAATARGRGGFAGSSPACGWIVQAPEEASPVAIPSAASEAMGAGSPLLVVPSRANAMCEGMANDGRGLGSAASDLLQMKRRLGTLGRPFAPFVPGINAARAEDLFDDTAAHFPELPPSGADKGAQAHPEPQLAAWELLGERRRWEPALDAAAERLGPMGAVVPGHGAATPPSQRGLPDTSRDVQRKQRGPCGILVLVRCRDCAAPVRLWEQGALSPGRVLAADSPEALRLLQGGQPAAAPAACREVPVQVEAAVPVAVEASVPVPVEAAVPVPVEAAASSTAAAVEAGPIIPPDAAARGGAPQVSLCGFMRMGGEQANSSLTLPMVMTEGAGVVAPDASHDGLRVTNPAEELSSTTTLPYVVVTKGASWSGDASVATVETLPPGTVDACAPAAMPIVAMPVTKEPAQPLLSNCFRHTCGARRHIAVLAGSLFALADIPRGTSLCSKWREVFGYMSYRLQAILCGWHRPRRPPVVLALWLLAGTTRSLPGDGLAERPPMGYNSWNDVECNPSEGRLRASAAKLKSSGLAALGYEYVVVDDCWMESRRPADGSLVPDRSAFPGGMDGLGRYLHGMGLKFGIYTDRGETTCAGRPSSRGHEALHAEQFASWGVDFVKNDGCNDPECGDAMQGFPQSGSCPRSGRLEVVKKYLAMAKALNRSGRPVIQSICGWQPWFAPVGRHIGHMWRISADVRRWADVFEATQIMARLREYHGPHGWNDPDMLIGSSQGARLVLTPQQSRAQFSLWAVMSAPLMLGANMQELSQFDLETYSNADAIRVNQDLSDQPAGRVVLNNCPPYPEFHLGLGPDLAPEFDVSSAGGPIQLDPPKAAADPDTPSGWGRSVDSASGKTYYYDLTSGKTQWEPPLEARRYANKVSCGGHYEPTCETCPRGHGAAYCHGDCGWNHTLNKCVDGSLYRPPLPDRPGPWSLGDAKAPHNHQCQIVWAKTLSTQSVALVAVNFAQVPERVTLSLADLGFPAAAHRRDLWTKDTVLVNWSIDVELAADGGSVLWELWAPGAPAPAPMARTAAPSVAVVPRGEHRTHVDLQPDLSLVSFTGFAVLVLLAMLLCRRHCSSGYGRQGAGSPRSPPTSPAAATIGSHGMIDQPSLRPPSPRQRRL
ncbi:unnamed protein product, partial [Prorocentrum cordatum]